MSYPVSSKTSKFSVKLKTPAKMYQIKFKWAILKSWDIIQKINNLHLLNLIFKRVLWQKSYDVVEPVFQHFLHRLESIRLFILVASQSSTIPKMVPLNFQAIQKRYF